MELEPLFKCKQLENDQDLHDSVLCIKDSNSYHSPTNLSEMKHGHGEKWIQTVTAIYRYRYVYFRAWGKPRQHKQNIRRLLEYQIQLVNG